MLNASRSKAAITTGGRLFLIMLGLFLAGCGQTTGDVPQAAKDTFQAYVNLELQGYEEAKDKVGDYLAGPALNLVPHFASAEGALEEAIRYTFRWQ